MPAPLGTQRLAHSGNGLPTGGMGDAAPEERALWRAIGVSWRRRLRRPGRCIAEEEQEQEQGEEEEEAQEEDDDDEEEGS